MYRFWGHPQTRKVIEAREQHSEKNLGQLYDPKKMPKNLLKAHQELDRYVEKLYRAKPFNNDNERLAHLIDMYDQREKKRV